LDLIYPNQYTYEYKETDNQYSSHLTIPFVWNHSNVWS
jgi:hypothetical protein